MHRQYLISARLFCLVLLLLFMAPPAAKSVDLWRLDQRNYMEPKASDRSDLSDEILQKRNYMCPPILCNHCGAILLRKRFANEESIGDAYQPIGREMTGYYHSKPLEIQARSLCSRCRGPCNL